MTVSISPNKILEGKIRNSSRHSRLDLQRDKLIDADIEYLIQEAIINKQCSMLWLRENQISSHGISMLISALNENTTLEGLSLCNNNITDDNVISLSRQLATNKCQLNRLALTSNEITDQGAEYLSQMLKTNQTLTQLWLGFNKITNDGLKLLMDCLAHHNRTLHILSLAWNSSITDEGVDVIVEMLECNQILKTFCLSNCGFTDIGKAKLRIAAKGHFEFYIDL